MTRNTGHVAVTRTATGPDTDAGSRHYLVGRFHGAGVSLAGADTVRCLSRAHGHDVARSELRGLGGVLNRAPAYVLQWR
jgi:hypothetical protein